MPERHKVLGKKQWGTMYQGHHIMLIDILLGISRLLICPPFHLPSTWCRILLLLGLLDHLVLAVVESTTAFGCVDTATGLLVEWV